MITEAMLPIIIVPLTFLFVLLIILIVKSPKAGACVIGGLLLLTPLFFWRLAAAGAPDHGGGLALWVMIVPATFLFVLLVILLTKAPRLGAGLIVAVVVMVVLGLFLAPAMSRRTARLSTPTAAAWAVTAESTGHDTSLVVIDHDQQVSLGLDEPGMPPAAPAHPVTPSPIWSEGVEQEFQADVYPSKLAAVRALGLRVDRLIRGVGADFNSLPPITLFQHEQERELIVELRTSIQRALPEAVCTIEAELRSLRPGEIGMMLQFPLTDMDLAPWGRSEQIMVGHGRAEINAQTTDRRATLHSRFTDKPWIENFAAFANTKPDQHFLIARSQGTCTSESEASQQALHDAQMRLTEVLGRSDKALLDLPRQALTTRDVLDGGFIVDRFAQSFDGSAGKIWRHALLLDASGSKLARLAEWKAREAHSTRVSWARMGFSMIGVLVLIGTIYFFLNMATRGYYDWSLRIAGVVLAIVAIVSILMIVQ